MCDAKSRRKRLAKTKVCLLIILKAKSLLKKSPDTLHGVLASTDFPLLIPGKISVVIDFSISFFLPLKSIEMIDLARSLSLRS